MKKKTAIIINSNKTYKLRGKVISIIVLILLLGIIVYQMIKIPIVNEQFAKDITTFTRMNDKTIFSIDKIYMYSSASAINNKAKRPIWNLNVFQYTDIAIYLNNHSEKLDYENSIKKMYITNLKIDNIKKGKANLYYKNINDFGKFKNYEENEIKDTYQFEIVKNGEIDYERPQIYSDCSMPITLGYINKNIKENQILSDISQDVVYNGELLRKSEIILSDIEGIITFNIIIENFYNQKFVANVYIKIPLQDLANGQSIYNGKYIEIKGKNNKIKFFRIK